MKQTAGLSSFVIVALAILLLGGRAWAHGGGAAQLTNEPAGPYTISAWTNPDPPTMGALHLTIGVALASTGEALTEPQVVVNALPPDGSTALRAVATHEGALTPYFYEADLTFSMPGRWRVQIEVRGDEGEGDAAFTLDVREAAPNYLLWGGIGLGLAVVLWLGWMLARER